MNENSLVVFLLIWFTVEAIEDLKNGASRKGGPADKWFWTKMTFVGACVVGLISALKGGHVDRDNNPHGH